LFFAGDILNPDVDAFCTVCYLTFILPPILIFERQQMKITLRKANALQIAIGEAVKNIDINTDVKINEFQVGELEIARVAAEFHANVARRTQLINTMYAIRKAVSTANAGAGVDVKLADVAMLEKQVQFYNGLAGKKVRESAAVVEGQLNKLRESKDDSRRSIYGYASTVDTSVLSPEDIRSFRSQSAEARKAKQKLQDELLEINVRTEIEIAQDAVQFLTAEGLL
jgi:hypothetical protein